MKLILLKNFFKYTTHLDYIIFSSFDRNTFIKDYGDYDDGIIENYVRSMKSKGITWDEIVFQKENHTYIMLVVVFMDLNLMKQLLLS